MIASMPLKPGIWRSINVTSGRCNRNCLIASCPLDASATNFMSSSALTNAAMPSRRRGWSSTLRTRIGLGLVLMTSRFTEYSKFSAFTRCVRGIGDRNGQLNFGARSGFAPEIQLGTDSLRTFTNPGQTPVSGACAFLQDFWVNAFSIIADTQAKHAMVVTNLGFDLTCTCVLKSIA